ncbi:MAG: hypothetical protein QGG42_11700 [Phycisphaerae bacterium]|nr:hypothetical protein [Phycisphaerae bacterium]
MKTLILPLCLVALLCYGCVDPIPAPPHTLAEFTELQRTHPQEYANSTVMRHNIQRVLDPDLPTADREASLDLIASLVGPGGQLPAEVSAALDQDDCPPTLRKRILGQGVAVATVRNGSNSATTVTNGGAADPLPLNKLAQAPAGPRRRATLRWLIENPKPEALADLCKLWASEAPNGSDEQLFRQAVGGLGAGKWQDVLLDSLNAKKFAARGSALSVLSARGAEIDLLNRITAMTAQTVSIQTMQTFVEKFGYIPANGGQLLASVIVHAENKGVLDKPALLAKQWSAKYNYKFNIRDYHLLNKLSVDATRNKIERDELVKQIVQKLAVRRHVDRSAGPFSRQAAQMTMPDLWNIVLIDEMLHRKRVSLALRILADRLRAGLNSPRSGLVFFEGGKAAAKLYPQGIDSTQGDRDHIPERELQRAGFSAMCHLHTRFEKVYNGDRAPTSKRELSAARQANFYGLVLTSIDSGTFSAFYYNPDGAVVSLGLFAFGK